LYNDLLSDGIDDVEMMGINGFQYINDSYTCMICETPDNCSSCDEIRTLPWAQDTDTIDVWGEWDVAIRDFVILNRDGIEFARVNLTPFNPDTEGTAGCSGNYEAIKQLILDARNQ